MSEAKPKRKPKRPMQTLTVKAITTMDTFKQMKAQATEDLYREMFTEAANAMFERYPNLISIADVKNGVVVHQLVIRMEVPPA